MALLGLLVLFSLANLYAASVLPTCICPMVFAPVCGDDGKTYGNECEMSCTGHHLLHRGGCNTVIQADTPEKLNHEEHILVEYKPVEHHPDDAAEETHLGGVPDDTHLCACPRNLHPICGQDGKTYNNPCELNCAGAAFFQDGPCHGSGGHVIHKRATAPCICTFIYRPVCGSDGISYGNDCNRECASKEAELLGKSAITVASDGPCPRPVATTTANP